MVEVVEFRNWFWHYHVVVLCMELVEGKNVNSNGGRLWFATIPSSSDPDLEDKGFWTFDHVSLVFIFSEMMKSVCNYIKVVLEHGSADDPEEEAPYVHWHAHIQFRRPHRMRAVKRFLAGLGRFECSEAHLEKIMDPESVEEYIDGDLMGPKAVSKLAGILAGPFSWSRAGMSIEKRGQGCRTDLFQFTSMLEAGSSVPDCARAYPSTFMTFHSGAQKLWSIFNTPRERPRPQVVWLTGPTGCGKSRLARDKCRSQGLSVYLRTPEMGQWWDGFIDQDVILFDDFDDVNAIGTMLRLLDYTPNQQQVKGGVVAINCFRFIFTLHLHVSESIFSPHPIMFYFGIVWFYEFICICFIHQFTDCFHGNAKQADFVRRITEFCVYERDFALRPVSMLEPGFLFPGGVKSSEASGL